MKNLLLSWLLLFPIGSILLTIENNVVYGRCPEDQQSLLLELKNNLTYYSSSSEKLTQWNASTNYCNWNGVSCYDGCVIGLDLSNEFIFGVIDNSSSLFNLRFLQNLSLAWNNFNSPIPSGFERLSNLSVLNMSDSGFRGQIPIGISSLTRLVTLDFTRSSRYQPSTVKLENPNLMTLVQNLSNLRVLILDGVDLSAGESIIDSISYTLFGFPQMTTLKLAYCKLKRFPGFLKNQSQLASLDLSHNELEGKIPFWILELRHLSLLNLSYNSLDGFEGSPQNLSSSLYLLDFHSNEFRGPLTFFPPSAAYLDFSENNISSIICPSIRKATTNLQVLNLSYNKLSGVFPQCLTYMLTNDVNKSRVVLNLRGNALNGFLPNTFPVTCGLRSLDLSGNNLGGQVPSSLSNCRYLEVLDLQNNHIRDIFPCPLRNIPTLRVLVLRSNQFQGKIGCLESNDTWPSLQVIDLSRNNFSGDIPGKFLMKCKAMMDGEEYKILTTFTSIDFSCNHFNGHIPVEIGELRALQLLNLSHNSLFGEIPSSIGNLSKLHWLDLSRNTLTGAIPSSIGNLSKLYWLDLSRNTLTGVIPSSIGNLSNLESLDLSNNMLTGAIPSQLAELLFLSFLNLSYNLLVGKIPSGQFYIFSLDSFVGNKGLCGDPLPNKCENAIPPTSDTRISEELSGNEFEWKYIYIFIATGFLSGAITGVIAGLTVWEKKSTTLMRWFSSLVFHNHERKVPEPSAIRWEPPPRGTWKLNSGALWDATTCRGGLGWIIRDHDGRPIGAGCSQVMTGNWQVEVLEISAVVEGLRMLKPNNNTPVIVESNSLTSIQLLRVEEEDICDIFTYVREIRLLQRSRNVVDFGYIQRDGNKIAEALARYAKDEGTSGMWWDEMPTWISSLLSDEDVKLYRTT